MRKPFQVSGERILSSFDVNDLLQNRSYIKFYAARAGASGDILTSVIAASSTIYTGSQTTFEINFDATIQNPVLIQGDAFCKMTYTLEGSGGTPQFTGTPSIRLLHYDGSTETALMTAAYPITSTTTGQCTTWLMKGTIAKKAFKIGDTLRLEVIMAVGGSVNATPTLFHDPAGRTVTLYDGVRPVSPDDSTLYIWIPFIPNL